MEKNTAPTPLRLTYGARDKRADCARLGPPLVTTDRKREWKGSNGLGQDTQSARFLDVAGNNITFTCVYHSCYLYRDLANRG